MVRGAAWRCLRAPGGKTAAVIAVAGLLFFTAGTASAQAGAPYFPPGYSQTSTSATYVAPTMPPPQQRTTSIRGLWIPGLIGLPVAYVATWVHASLTFPAGSDGVSTAFIPLAGPWLVLASQNADVAYYVTTGLVQDISFLCLVLGLAIRIPERRPLALGDATLDLAAMPTPSGGAFSATVQF
jgi:hypothetical protein